MNNDYEFIEIKKITTTSKVTSYVERKKFVELLRAIRDNYTYNNYFSLKLLEVLPYTKIIEIDVDRNRDCDIPFIVCIDFEDRQNVISIPRVHKIIWGVLEEFISNE
ncbi:MAG: hypothetical protein J6N78_00775 [Clostridia bacterium]|nr:hypothetical protein [Clostridia bacterium]